MNQDGGAVLPPDLSRELLWLPDDQLLGGQNEGLLNCFVFTAHILLLFWVTSQKTCSVQIHVPDT